jgi:hypothetical protein
MRFSWEIKSVDSVFSTGLTRLSDLSKVSQSKVPSHIPAEAYTVLAQYSEAESYNVQKQ